MFILFSFLFFFLFLFSFFVPFSPVPGIFLQEEEDSSEAVLIPTRSNTTDTAIKHWSLEKQHMYKYTHMHAFTVFVLLYFQGTFSNLSIQVLPIQTVDI